MGRLSASRQGLWPIPEEHAWFWSADRRGVRAATQLTKPEREVHSKGETGTFGRGGTTLGRNIRGGRKAWRASTAERSGVGEAVELSTIELVTHSDDAFVALRPGRLVRVVAGEVREDDERMVRFDKPLDDTPHK